MANYTLIEKITVGAAGAASITFSGIPQTGYTDLVVKTSGRSTSTTPDAYISFNGLTTDLSDRVLYSYSGSVGSNPSSTIRSVIDISTQTANTFANTEIYISNYTSANFKSVSIDSTTESNDASNQFMYLNAGLWSNTAAITSITMTPYASNNFAANSTFYLYGVAKLGTTPAIVPYATGGDTIMTDGTYWYHTFISSGTFTPAKAITCDYLVIAGGGSGAGYASNAGAGGGGAGGFRTATGFVVTAGSPITVTVGAGGAAVSSSVNGNKGNNSVFSTITSEGGGYGSYLAIGGAGGSGGGANGNNAGGTATSGQGSNGGSANGGSVGGGGGGKGGVGSSGVNATDVGGNGGAGLASSITGSSVTYAGGGGGGGYVTKGTGGSSIGGNGWQFGTNATNGTVNTGSGGGGGGGSANSGTGGSGIVIVRYLV